MLTAETKTEKATKAYQIDMSRISEGFLFDAIFCHAFSINEAKYELLSKVKYEGMELLGSKEELTYTSIPVIWYKEMDLHEFEGDYITQREIDRIIHKRKRIEYFDGILKSDVSHCYIRKQGSYYRPNASGYTSYKCFAGIYTKEDAVKHGSSCDDLQIIPIDSSEHNKMIEEEIEDLQSRIITIKSQL